MLPDRIKEAIDHYLSHMEGWFTPEAGCAVAEVIIDNKITTAVEIGTFAGRSSIAQGFALRENNNGGKVYCIDPWRTEYAVEGESPANREWWEKNIDIEKIHRECMEAIWKHNLDQWVVVIRAASQHVYQLFNDIGLLLIDGNHSEVASMRDVELYLPRVKKDGYVWFDDTGWTDESGNSTSGKAVKMIEGKCDVVKDLGNQKLYRKCR